MMDRGRAGGQRQREMDSWKEGEREANSGTDKSFFCLLFFEGNIAVHMTDIDLVWVKTGN